jgi:hypothetical protein
MKLFGNMFGGEKNIIPQDQGSMDAPTVPMQEQSGDTRIPKELLSSRVSLEEFEKGVAAIPATANKIEIIRWLLIGAEKYQGETEAQIINADSKEREIQGEKLRIILQKIAFLSQILRDFEGESTQIMS